MRVLALVCALLALCGCATTQPHEARVSAPGRYEGWAPELYSGYVRTSRYVPVRDGARLAMTIFRPATGGSAAETPYPVVFQFTPYRSRFHGPNGEIVSWLEDGRAGRNMRPLAELTHYGYVVVSVDIRGKGASYGARRGFLDRTEAQDAYDIIEWLAAQSWSTGAVGMAGCSYVGGTQLLAASAAPPHLRAIFTGGSDYDKFNFVRRGGILAQFNTRPDEPPEWDLATVPMDEDPDGAMLREAVAQHANNTPMAPLWRGMPYRDSVSSLVGTKFWEEVGVYRYKDAIERAGIAIYHWHNLNDEGRGEGMVAAANLHVPGKVLLGPGGHCEPPPITAENNFDLFAEHLRFYDRYLKGVRNGIDREPRYHYWTHGAPAGQEWASAAQWPPAALPVKSLQLGPGSSLSAAAPAAVGEASFAVDYNVSCPGVDPAFIFAPCPIDASGAAFTTAPLAEDTRLLGNPTAHVWISSSIDRANVFVYLEEVAADGAVSIISHGRLATAYRRVSQAPYDTLGQPWHSGLQADQETLAPGQAVEMAIALLPVSKIVPAGARLRFTIAGADPRQRDLQQIRIDPPPRISVHFGPERRSRIEIPMQPAAAPLN
ncbi:MAG: CocE/NonD family hydrolase [Hyphomonadaceae bacterium]|nr:CocE/NonD family hydrolase [Hyphomonadaceae bacterium]